jgi:hypothetical protein
MNGRRCEEPLEAILVDTPPRRRRFKPPRFTIFGLMVLTFVAAVAITPIYYVLRAQKGETSYWAIAALFGPIAPVLLMILFSLGLQVRKQFRRRRG